MLFLCVGYHRQQEVRSFVVRRIFCEETEIRLSSGKENKKLLHRGIEPRTFAFLSTNTYKYDAITNYASGAQLEFLAFWQV